MRRDLAFIKRDGGGTNEIIFHLLDGFIRDRKPELLLRDRKIKPQLSPSVVSVLCKQNVEGVSETFVTIPSGCRWVRR